MDISTTRTSTPTSDERLAEILASPGFGTHFTDHMFTVEWTPAEGWHDARVTPYGPLTLDPATAVLHYAQEIFEGMKAYRHEDGSVWTFRPEANAERMVLSSHRLALPELAPEDFVQAVDALVEVDQRWVPDAAGEKSLYIRPFMFSSDEVIGVRPSDNYKFLILLSPTGPYYNAPMRLYVEEQYVRAVPGGVGYAKAAGNYGAAMYATAQAKKKGYDQVLWTDAFEHKYVQEAGTMNVIFIIGDKAVTPDLGAGTILAGVTRNSALTLLKEAGFTVEERPLSIDEIIDSYKAGHLFEVFGTGTAATISLIKELRYKDFVMTFDTDKWRTAPTIKKWLNDIREGKREDKYGWMVKV